MSRLLAVCAKEFVQLRRDTAALFMLAGVPITYLLFFGYAVNTDVRNIPTVVYDQDLSLESRDFVHRLEATGFYDIVGYVTGYDEIRRALRSSRAHAAFVLPAHFGQRMRSARPTQAQLVVDGSDPQTVASATNAAASLVTGLSARLLSSRLAASGDRVEGISLEPTTWYNPELKTAIFIVPGLIGEILTMTMIMLTSVAIARERERGTLEQLIVSPLRRIELVIGKIAPYVVIGYAQMTLILLLGQIVFHVPFLGSYVLLYSSALLFIATCLAVGLFFSTLAKTQQQAVEASTLFMLPNIMLSGFMFPFDGMPKPAQWVAQLFPMTHFLPIVRGIALRGAGFGDIAPQIAGLAVLLVITITMTSFRFRKKLDA